MAAKPLYSEAQNWLKGSYHKSTSWLAHRPARVMFPAGLALGGGVGMLALLAIGGWLGIVLCVLLLGTAVPLIIGAEPVRGRWRRCGCAPRRGAPSWP